MKKIVLFIVASFVCQLLWAQNEPTGIHRCNSHEHYLKQLNDNPNFQINQNQIEEFTQRYIQEHINDAERGTNALLLTIPVVFHIVHNGDAVGSNENIADAYIQAQLQQLNADYRKLNSDAGSVPSIFQSVAADVEIEFCLATVDPSGNATTGIERILNSNASWTYGTNDSADPDISLKPSTIWNSSQYLNIWTVNFSDGTLGYAQFPGGTANTDGVVLLYSSVGSLTTPNAAGGVYGYGRTATHEVGHWMNLRHIWGDANCGSDLVSDTPLHNASNYGCPTYPHLSTCSGSPTEMTMNYMDYTDDRCMYMFTLGQKARMQALFTSGGARVSLASSSKCGSQISMNSTSTSVIEGTSCTSKQVTVTFTGVSLANNSTISLSTSGTATSGTDYTLSTTSVTLTPAAPTQSITININEDGVIESDETIIINGTITSGTATLSNSSLTFTITNDDTDPNLATYNVATAYFEGGTLASDGFSLWTGNTGATNFWTVSTNAGLTNNGMHITNSASTKALAYTGTQTSKDIVYKTITATGYSNLKLTFDYKCNGEISSGTYYDYGKILYVAGTTVPTLASGWTQVPNTPTNIQGVTSTTTVTYSLPAALYGTSFLIAFEWDNDNSVANNPPFTIDNIVITGEKPASVQTTNNSSAGYREIDFGPNETVNWFDNATGKVMLTLTNTSAHDYGCTRIEVIRSGDTFSSKTAWNSGCSNCATLDKIADKVFKITPQYNNPTGTYNITLYYTESEIAGWETSSGNVRSNLGVFKSSSDLTTLQAPAPWSAYAPTLAFSSGTDVKLTTSWNTGFSYFGIGAQPAAPAPIELGALKATPHDKSILLNWNTTTEINSAHFELLRSESNTEHFEKIAKIDAKGNSISLTNYSYVDYNVKNNVQYYYKIVEYDIDGKTISSNIVNAALIKNQASFALSPNPASTEIDLSFFSVINGNLEIKIFDETGKLVLEKIISDQNNKTVTLPIDQLTSGIYFIRSTVNGFSNIEKFIKLN